MSSAALIKKANQIAQFFNAQPDRQQAIADMARHLANTWPPVQREDLAQVDEDALDPLVREVLGVLARR